MIDKLTPYFTFIMVHLSLIFLVYPEKILDSTQEGHWLPILLGCMLEFFLLWLYLHVLVSFPRLDVVDIVTSSTSVWLSRICLLPLLVYFMSSIILLLRAHAEILTIVLTPNTPIWVLMLLILVGLYAAVSNIPAILRASCFVAFIFIPIIVFCLVCSLQNSEWENIFPVTSSSFSFISSSQFYSGVFAFSGFLFLGFVHPYIKLDSFRKWRYLLIFLIVIIPLYLLSVYLPLLVFGQEAAAKYLFPVIEAMETIDLFWSMFERITIFYVTVTLSFIIMYIAMLIWICSMLLQKLYIPVSRKKLSVSVTLVCYVCGCLIPSWYDIQRLTLMDTLFRFYCMILFPCLLGILTLFKRRSSPA